MEPDENLLEVKEVESFYGSFPVLRSLSITVMKGEVCVILGRNGMGKTSTLRTIMNILEPKRGQIYFKGEEITDRPQWDRIKRGIGYVSQERGLFTNLTVLENLEVSKVGDLKEEDLRSIYEVFPKLKELKNNEAKYLSGGERRMLRIAKVFVNRPDLLLLDEPTEGLQPSIVEQLTSTLKNLNENQNLTILLSEQNVPFCKEIGDRFLFMIEGTIRDSTESLDESRDLLKKYVGIR